MGKTLEGRVVLFLVLLYSWSTIIALDTSTTTSQHVLADQCRFTRYPTLCIDTLMSTTRRTTTVGANANDVLSILLDKTISETTQLQVQYRPDHIDDCSELMKMSVHRLNQSMFAMKKLPTINKADIQTWLSAALTFQQTCRDEVTKNTRVQSDELVYYASKRLDYVSRLISNTLSLVNRIEDNGSGGLGHRVEKIIRKLASGTIDVNAVVAKDGSGQYSSIMDAISDAYGSRYVIYVKEGVYNEKIHTYKDGITLIGDGKLSTIISGSSSVSGGTSLSGSATVTVAGDGFIAIDMGFQNTAGTQGRQAVAVNIASDHSVFFRCAIVGYQDTLYAHALRQFYRDCDIYGTIDFIFGNAAAVFQNCNLVLRKPRSGGYNAILANGRTDPGQNTGFSVQKSTITSDSSGGSYNSYLGRPWKAYSRAVVMQSSIGNVIASRGWVEWEGAGSSTYKTLYFAEYANTGSGASTSNRVQWSGHRLIDSSEASKFTVANFIGGASWLPSTGIIFASGL